MNICNINFEQKFESKNFPFSEKDKVKIKQVPIEFRWNSYKESGGNGGYGSINLRRA